MFQINTGNTNRNCCNPEAEAMRKSPKEVLAMIAQLMVNAVNLVTTTTEGIAVTTDKEVEVDLEVEKENRILTIIGPTVGRAILMTTIEADKVDLHTMDPLEVMDNNKVDRDTATVLAIPMEDPVEDEGKIIVFHVTYKGLFLNKL